MGATSVDPAVVSEVEATHASGHDTIAVTPEHIVEAALFVGGRAGCVVKTSEIVEHVRDVDATEVEQLIDGLNEKYYRTNAPYQIVRSGTGFRFQLLPSFDHLQRRVSGNDRVARLSRPAMEVLSLVAYRQPITAQAINAMRGLRSHAILAQLVRRKLLTVEKLESDGTIRQYRTTGRFNQIFGISSPAELPKSQDLDDF